MRLPEPNLPSFSFVLNENQPPQPSLRAPAPRYSHVLRFKPYARPSNIRSRRDTLMATVDERTYDYNDDLAYPSSNWPTGQTDPGAVGIHEALNASPGGVAADRRPGVGLRLVTLVIDLALYVVRKARMARNVDN